MSGGSGEAVRGSILVVGAPRPARGWRNLRLTEIAAAAAVALIGAAGAVALGRALGELLAAVLR